MPYVKTTPATTGRTRSIALPGLNTSPRTQDTNKNTTICRANGILQFSQPTVNDKSERFPISVSAFQHHSAYHEDRDQGAEQPEPVYEPLPGTCPPLS